MKWLHVAHNVAWVRKTFFCNERIKNVALNVNVNKATHCVRDYEYPLKSTCQLYWSCKNVINLSTILKSQKCYQTVNYTEVAKMLSTCQLYWSCKNVINLSTILKLQKCYQPVNYTEAAKMLFILHLRKVNRNYLTFLWKVKNFS